VKPCYPLGALTLWGTGLYIVFVRETTTDDEVVGTTMLKSSCVAFSSLSVSVCVCVCIEATASFTVVVAK